MAMMSGMFHESRAKEKAAEELRESKYGGEKKADTMVDLAEPSIQGVLMKKIVRPGNGEIPPVGSTVRVHYTGKLKDGTEFETSAGRGPETFVLGKGEVIRGWDYAVSTMQLGERAVLTVGPHYGYGLQGSGPIPPNATLTFEMELMGWDKPALMEWYQWVGLLVMVVIIVYVLCFDDHSSASGDSAPSPQEL